MKFGDLVAFRRDLLFNGAVQLGWLEDNQQLAVKAAENFVFHGPEYHGVASSDFQDSTHLLMDTAQFSLDILNGISGNTADEPFALAIAGYGTGKSHLAVTLSTLLAEPRSSIAKKIVANLIMADTHIGQEIDKNLKSIDQPFLVVAINGMQDFDLSNEIVRQILNSLQKHGQDTSPLENLRPRFRSAVNFTESFYESLKPDFDHYFSNTDYDQIIMCLQAQNEDVFIKINAIYEQKMGAALHTVGKEALEDFIRVTKDTYCGLGRPFAGIVIIFDEFGRYMEFSVQKPHIAGSGALQQLFECVQANADRVFLLAFIQYELKAYISRVAPELREDLNRYVTRFDGVRKVRLSTNLETLIANLLEKKDKDAIDKYYPESSRIDARMINSMHSWFPDMHNHSVWMDTNRFDQIISKGCWPLHPFTTWLLYKLSSVGKSLQQRSALSLLAEVYDEWANNVVDEGMLITPVALCNQSLIDEFLASEQYGQQGAAAHAFESVVHKYQNELTSVELSVLKAVLLCSKIGVKVISREDCLQIINHLCGITQEACSQAIHLLESDYNVLEWNDRLRQYEIVGDAAPKKVFIDFLHAKIAAISSEQRAIIFAQNYMKWAQKATFPTDFATQKHISTREWNYKNSFTNIQMLKSQIGYDFRSWRDAIGVDQEKGRLIYCYVGPDSNLEAVKSMAELELKAMVSDSKMEWQLGAPIAVLFLEDQDGTFAEKVSEYWVLNEQIGDEEAQKFNNFILDRKNNLEQELFNQFAELEKARQVIMATNRVVTGNRLASILVNLFATVYDKLIPFPFDGFHTANGNAAKDCQLFTRELFLGSLDRDWIAARNAQQRNRAYEVIDKSWGFVDPDGSIRLKPQNQEVRAIIELIESGFSVKGEEESNPVNLGLAMRTLCAPPYGLNIASAGLLLGAYFGRRKKSLNLLKKGEPININDWLADALRRNYLEITILDNTEIVQVSEASITEWEQLLADWGIETTYSGKLQVQNKARELAKKTPIPQELHYRYLHFDEQAKNALIYIKNWEQNMGEARDRIEIGKEKEDVGQLSRGAAELLDIYHQMRANKDCWQSEQILIVEQHLAAARVKIQPLFSKWLNGQRVSKIEKSGEYHHRMLKIGGNLESLGFPDENQALKKHVEEVEKHVKFMEQLKKTTADIDNLINMNRVTNSTPVVSLNKWLEQVQELKRLLDQAVEVTIIAADEVRKANQKLAVFQKECMEQLERNKKRIEDVYNNESISSLSEIASWRAEIAQITDVYKGFESDVADLKAVQIQLDNIENHYKLLDNTNLPEAALLSLYEQCMKEAEQLFVDDSPPLDNEFIYAGIMEVINNRRSKIGNEWLKHSLPDVEEIKRLNAGQTNQCLSNLRNMPAVLSAEQVKTVNRAISACEMRLDELDVEGVLVKFQGLSEDNKKAFIALIVGYLRDEVNVMEKLS